MDANESVPNAHPICAGARERLKVARVFQTYEYGVAQLQVALVHDQGRADLLVCRVNSWGLARGDALWFITNHYQEATVRIHFGSPGTAQLLVCFVHTVGMAGWQREHHWQGKLG